jgi:23S rRNA (adenine2503-C2)-methyltransferase
MNGSSRGCQGPSDRIRARLQEDAMDTPKPLARDLAPAACRELLVAMGHAPYRGRQLARWLHRRDALAWEELTDLPTPLRGELAARYDLQGLHPEERVVSQDGTRKYLFILRDGAAVESVLIPMERHPTFCLSSQVGCAMACRFCATAQGGKQRDLSCGEILEQVVHLRRDLAAGPVPGHGGRQFNVVFMGMGEPLDNWPQVRAAIEALTNSQGGGISTRRITISTAGPLAGLERFVAEAVGVGLTLSLGGASEALRRRLTPVAARTSLRHLMELAGNYAHRSRRRVTLAYVLISGVNDGPAEARQLARLAAGGPFKVNLIPLNPLDDADLRPSPPERHLPFQQVLRQAGVQATLRASGGQDIAAACGQLRQRHRTDGSRDRSRR